MCIIIGDVHQFIGHCLIPLDPWKNLCFENLKQGSNWNQESTFGMVPSRYGATDVLCQGRESHFRECHKTTVSISSMDKGWETWPNIRSQNSFEMGCATFIIS